MRNESSRDEPLFRKKRENAGPENGILSAATRHARASQEIAPLSAWPAEDFDEVKRI